MKCLRLFSGNRLWHPLQIVSLGDNLHELSMSVFWVKINKKQNIMKMSAAVIAQRVVKADIFNAADSLIMLIQYFKTYFAPYFDHCTRVSVGSQVKLKCKL